MSTEYSVELQKFFLEMMIEDAQNYVRVQNIFKPQNFDRSLTDAAKFISDHTEKYKGVPSREQIKAACNISLQEVPDLSESHNDWFLETFEQFTKRRELERAILKSADLIEKGEYEPVEKLVKDAVQITITRNMGTDYFADPRGRLEKLKDSNGQISSGWTALDKKLFGGMNRGELNIFAGGSGSGKSLFMQNLAVNWFSAGMNGVYITLELSEELSAMRIDSMVTEVSTRNIFKQLDDVELKVRMRSKSSGKFQLKYLPAQSTVNDIRAYLKELQIKEGWKPDFLLIDYLDLLMPVSARVSPSDLFVKDKYVSEELRNLARELDCVFVTASQLNRGAVEEVEFDHSHISGGLSKINTADNVFGIYTSRAMREKGRYQLQLMKTRSSSGVGQKINLAFDLETLRIFDADDDADEDDTGSVTISKLSKGKIVEADEDSAPVRGEIQSSKIKSMLADLQNND